MTMKRTLLVAATAIALSAPAVPHTHAAELTVGAPAQVIDIRRHIVVMNGSADDARFGYAKIICRPRLGAEAGAPNSVLPHAYVACLRSQGFAWILDGSAQIAARNKAAQDEREPRDAARDRRRPHPDRRGVATARLQRAGAV
jgi:hypothetical protein